MREKVWFPGIDILVEQTVEACLACQATTSQVKREPLSKLPATPWKQLRADFCELPGGIYLLVVIDDYSRFPVVEILSSTYARTVIPRLDRIFSEYGVPDVVRTDNGPPLTAENTSSMQKALAMYHALLHLSAPGPMVKLNAS